MECGFSDSHSHNLAWLVKKNKNNFTFLEAIGTYLIGHEPISWQIRLNFGCSVNAPLDTQACFKVEGQQTDYWYQY